MEPNPVNELTFDQLLDDWADVEAAVDATAGIDHWCSALDWVVPVASGFAPRGKRLLLRSAEGNGYALLGFYRRESRIFLSGIEPLWGFASPIFGPDVAALTDELTAHLQQRSDWSMLVLAGLPPLPHRLSRTIVDGLAPLGVSLFTDGMTRRVADLTDGYEPWLAARSSRFRRNLRQAEARAVDAGLSIEHIDSSDTDSSDTDAVTSTPTTAASTAARASSSGSWTSNIGHGRGPTAAASPDPRWRRCTSS